MMECFFVLGLFHWIGQPDTESDNRILDRTAEYNGIDMRKIEPQKTVRQK